ncbi:MAG: SH3 domain-containing protein [Burkholderiales bacterium]|nr:SH3 domain-containing protein [Burkholderiales bacterium]
MTSPVPAQRPHLARLLAASAALLLVSVAAAQQAFVNARTNLRAGPDRGYPQVAWLSPGTGVYVHGCVRGYHWCDVSSGPLRGWANARHLNYLHQGRNVAIFGYGPRLGLPIIGYTAGTYWDTYYRDRPFYSRRDYWNSWHPGTPAPRYVAPAPQQQFVPAPRQPHYLPPAAQPQHPHYRSQPPAFVAPPRQAPLHVPHPPQRHDRPQGNMPNGSLR